jgi:hypothetical protein
MTQSFTLRIIISKDGETVEGQVEGMKGHSCEDVQHVLDQVGQEIEHHHTADFDKSEPVQLGGKTSGTLKLGGGR